MIARDKDRKILKIKFWIFEMSIQNNEHSYFANWKFGEKLVGSFTKIK